MKPGRELDALISEKVMGKPPQRWHDDTPLLKALETLQKTTPYGNRAITMHINALLRSTRPNKFRPSLLDGISIGEFRELVEKPKMIDILEDVRNFGKAGRAWARKEFATNSIPYYSTDIAAAWHVAVWLIQKWEGFHLEKQPGGRWVCSNRADAHNRPHSPRILAHGETPEMAICLAALNVAGVKIPT